jgi:AmiR/NasT family two-component response regulator
VGAPRSAQGAEQRLSISALIRDFRALDALVLMPPGPEGDELTQHLRRIGCRHRVMWPPPEPLPAGVDVVFVAVRPIIEERAAFAWDADDPPACLIAVVDYENPLIMERVLTLQAQGVIGLPLRPIGVMTNVLLGVASHTRSRRLKARFNRVYARLRARTIVERAKLIVAARRGVPPQQAYALIREQAMNRRATVEEVARGIVAASEILDLG